MNARREAFLEHLRKHHRELVFEKRDRFGRPLPASDPQVPGFYLGSQKMMMETLETAVMEWLVEQGYCHADDEEGLREATEKLMYAALEAARATVTSV